MNPIPNSPEVSNAALPSSLKVGVIGGGQLGRMLALAGYPLGIRCRHIGGPDDTSAREVADYVAAPQGDMDTLAKFARSVDVVTYESENVPVETAELVAKHTRIHPSVRALQVSQDRLFEKEFFASHGIATAPFAKVDSCADLDAAIAKVGLPAVLKTRRLGYDGKGQAVIRTAADADAAWQQHGSVPLILEGFVKFDREVSIIAVRSPRGETRFYPLVENHHEAGILRLSIAPAPRLTAALQEQAQQLAATVLEHLDYVGVLAIELFQCGDVLLANEMAPRVHNSGHWTIEGAVTSQFENHLRAILDLPLGSTAAVVNAAMINLIGGIPALSEMLRFDDTHVHVYGKHPRPGRKVGHITVLHHDAGMLRGRAEEIQRALSL